MKEKIQQSLIWWRRRSGLTQAQVAKLINIGRPAYGSYEEGRAQPSHQVLISLCDIYGVSSVECFIEKREEAKGSTKKDKLYYNYLHTSHQNRKIIDFILKIKTGE